MKRQKKLCVRQPSMAYIEGMIMYGYDRRDPVKISGDLETSLKAIIRKYKIPANKLYGAATLMVCYAWGLSLIALLTGLPA